MSSKLPKSETTIAMGLDRSQINTSASGSTLQGYCRSAVRDNRIENRPLTSIRGVAALWVFALHMTEGTPSATRVASMGYTAVDTFFILSGMILAGVYSNLTFGSIGGFWLKRICRVYPAHISSLLVLTIVVVAPKNVAALWNAVANLPYAGSALLLQPYISLHTIGNPVAWSISIELGCYLLFPLIIVCVRRMPALGYAAIVALMMSLIVEWEVFSRFRGIDGLPAVSRGLAGFGLGVMIWRVGSGLTLTWLGASIFESIGLIGIASCITNNDADPIPLWAAVLLFGSSFDCGVVAKCLRWRWVYWLGSISFSIYLLHYPMMLIVEKWLPIRSRFSLEEVRRLVATVLLTLIASTVSYWLVEKPGRRIPALLRGSPPVRR